MIRFSTIGSRWLPTVLVVVLAMTASSLVVLTSDDARAQSDPALCGNVSAALISPFDDVVSGLYGADYIACLKHLGLTKGKGDGSFGRIDELTRAEMATFLARLWRLISNRECSSGNVPFTDIAEGDTHYDGIRCIYNLNITKGKTATTFDPDSSVTAAQLSLFLSRLHETSGNYVACRAVENEFDYAASCLESINVIPSVAEGRSIQPVLRAQVAVYVVGLWLSISGREVPHPPSRPSTLDRSRVLSYDYPNEPADDRSPAWSPDGSRLAFGEGWFGGDGLYTTKVDGSDRRKLAEEGRSPAWSPDGTQIAFFDLDGLYVIDADGGNLRTLTSPSDEYWRGFSPAWSPDGKQIAFVDRGSLYVINADGSNLRELDHSEIVGSALHPTWSHDGNRIFFTAATDIRTVSHRGHLERRHFWVIDADGANPARITIFDGINPNGDPGLTRYNSFALSPDDKRVAFTSRDGVYVMNTDRSSLLRIRSVGGNYITPAWSPDGNFIAVAAYHDDDYHYDILVMRPDGSDVRRLTSGAGDEYYPAWSPESGRIAYLANPVTDGSEFDDGIHVVDLAALSPFSPTAPSVPPAQKLTSNRVDDWNPVWSPDGNRIAFVRQPGADSDSEIYIMDADGSNERRLTNNRFDDFDPIWSPDSKRVFFVRERGQLDYELYSVDAGSGREKNIPFDQNGIHNLSWSLSPDGGRIAYAARGSVNSGWTKLFVMNSDGTGIRRLISSHGEDYPLAANYTSPIWSPDGDQIAFIITNHHSSELYDIHLISADGSDARLLASPGQHRNIAWSSSDRIAFSRKTRDFNSIFSIAPNGSELQQVIGSPNSRSLSPGGRICPRTDLTHCREGGWSYSSIVWSPDGKRIAFLESDNAVNSRISAIANVFLANSDGSDLRQLTSTLTRVQDIAWSPDGRRILFASSRGTSVEPRDDLEIYIIDVS